MNAFLKKIPRTYPDRVYQSFVSQLSLFNFCQSNQSKMLLCFGAVVWWFPVVSLILIMLLCFGAIVWWFSVVSLILIFSWISKQSVMLCHWYGIQTQTCLPICIWPYFDRNQPTVRMYADISQDMDKQFPESREIVMWTNASLLPSKSIVESCWSYHSLTLTYFKPFPGLKYMAGPDWSKSFLNQWTSTVHWKLYGSY